MSAAERAKAISCNQESGRFIHRQVNGKLFWGIADANGAIVIEPSYRAIICFRNGVSWVAVDSKRQWCPINSVGTRAKFPACVSEKYFTKHPYERSEGTEYEIFSDDPYENSVLWTRAYLEYGAGMRSEPPKPVD